MERQNACGRRREQVSERLSPPDADAGTSGTEPDHALWWRRDVSLYAQMQDVRVVHKALFMGRRRWPDSRRIGYMKTPFWIQPRC